MHLAGGSGVADRHLGCGDLSLQLLDLGRAIPAKP